MKSPFAIFLMVVGSFIVIMAMRELPSTGGYMGSVAAAFCLLGICFGGGLFAWGFYLESSARERALWEQDDLD